MFIAYLIIAVSVICLALILMAFAYPELLLRGGKGLFRLLMTGGKCVVNLGVAAERRIAKGVQHAEKGPIDTLRRA